MFLMKVPLFKPSLTKDCWNSHLIVGLPKKRRHEKKKTNKKNVLSRGKLKCRNSAGLVLLQVLIKARNQLKRLKTI